MKRIGYITNLLAIALLWGALSSIATAQTADLREIRPYMMLVVDTSGSMERLPACSCSTPGCEECLPDCGLANVAGTPPVDGTSGKQLKKNRWAVTLEALTGTFNDFECEALPRTVSNGMSYDLGYYLPYHQPWDCSATPPGEACDYDSTESILNQNTDGILDQYRTRVRFGLMAFDGWDTYVGAPPLVTATDFSDTLSEGIQGLWSYGGAKTFHYPNCTTNYMMDTGVRAPIADEGSLISLDSCDAAPCPSWCTACPATQQTINTDIQEALLGVRPYGGTPIAASLDDLYYHLKDDLSDDFGACRNRFALLITDGYPDDDYRSFGCDCKVDQLMTDPDYCGGPPNDPSLMHCPYPKPEDVAHDLVHGRSGDPAQLEQLYVVGLAIDDAAVFDRLNAIAAQGCSADDCDPDGDGNEALFADDLAQLFTNLSAVIEDNLEPISRSVPSFVTGGPSAKQFQISTGFKLPVEEGDPWTGVIERRRFTCASGALTEQTLSDGDGDLFHETLNAKASRDLFTAEFTGTSGDGWIYASTDAGSGCPATGCAEPLPSLQSELPNVTATYTRMGLPDGDDAQRLAVLSWMRGQASSVRSDKKLGDIYHSSPVVVGAPRFDTADEAFNVFRQRLEVKTRPQVLYVGTNDGIINAFSTDAWTQHVDEGTLTYAAGEEMWGFVPPVVLNKMKNNPLGHQFTMDGTPVVKDVYFDRDKSLNPDGSEYHTVLITGMRGGGNAYVALDVTDPTEPKFLWQFTDPMMGLTYAQPAIGQATFEITDGGTTTTKNGAVAILPGGKGSEGDSGMGDCAGVTTPSFREGGTGAVFKTFPEIPNNLTSPFSHRGDLRCWEAAGRGLYFVDVETGQLIKKITEGAVVGQPFFPAPLVGSPALFQDEVGTLASRAFLVDQEGVVWRIDLSADDPLPDDPLDGWTARPFHDVFWDQAPSEGQPSYEAPILTVDDASRLVVLVGTGDTDNFTSLTAENRVVSLTEVLDPGVTAVTDVEDWSAALNWERRVKATDGFEVSELVTGAMELFNGTLYFGTFIAVAAGADACDLGKGRLHAVHYRNRDTGDANGSSPLTFGPELIDVGGDTQADSLINTSVASAADNFMVMGLNITQRPTCTVIDTADFNVWNQTVPAIESFADPAVYLVAQASGDTGVGSAIQERRGSQFGSIEVNLERQSDARSTSSRIMSWATSVE